MQFPEGRVSTENGLKCQKKDAQKKDAQKIPSNTHLLETIHLENGTMKPKH